MYLSGNINKCNVTNLKLRISFARAVQHLDSSCAAVSVNVWLWLTLWFPDVPHMCPFMCCCDCCCREREPASFTLNLRLVHYEVLVVPAALELFAVATVETHVLVLRLVEREKLGREAAVTSISGQDSQRFLLKYGSRYTLTTHSRACIHTHTHTHTCTPHLLRARVHTLLHGHVLDDGAEGESQRDVVRPVETPFEDGAAVWNTHTHTHTHTKRQQKHYIVQFYGYWASSSIRLASVHWPLMKSSLRDSPRVYRGLNLPTHSTNGCSYIPAVCGWPLTPGLHSGLMHRPFITRADKSCLGLAQEVLNCETSRTLVCFFFAHLYRMMGQLFSAQRTFSEWIIEMNETSSGFNIMGFNRRVVSSICLWEVENYCVSCQPLSTHHPHWHTHTHITLSLTSFHRRSGTNRGKKPNTCSSLLSRIPIYDSKELKVMRSE